MTLINTVKFIIQTRSIY